MISKEEAYKKIASLIERFDEQKEFYKRSDYNETLTRRDFIDPFFKALGWDIDNEQGYAESYREVIHEDKIKIGKATKAPDYSFRLGGGKRLFFVEAKKPSVLIKDEITPAYQVRRYGWSAKLAISLITDFEEFAIYDCTKKPNLTDKASHARIKYLTYQQYLTEFDFIWDTFSKEKVLKGSFDKFVAGNKQKKGTTTVDHEFLISLDTWRTYLANNIALRNNIDEEELNFVVQHIIDRLIFLRIAEDRGVERYGNIQSCIAPLSGRKGTGGEPEGAFYQNLLKQFHTADQRYNSGLFDFSKDKVSGNIEIDNKIIKNIINDLYYPVSPYEFSVISVEILGSAYEQFLGKTISLSKSGRAVIEEKPEVRKAGGVYYTPEYIVEYIVKNTVGKVAPLDLSEGGKKVTPAEVAKLKIVDPACGSGSFLLGAYDYLLKWHLDYYTNNGKPSKGSKDNPLTPDGNLTTAEKKRILLNNIFGVDLDANAVEVTKLSLLLKCMEGETEASIETQLKLFHERVLPTLDNNIKSGNSLIDTDFYANELFEEEKKIKPFNWQRAFPEVFNIKKPSPNEELRRQYNKVIALQNDAEDLIKKYRVDEPEVPYGKVNGFDIVIGNPPYGATISKSVDTYLREKYQVANYQLDTYTLFVERGKNLLRDGGYLGYIIPSAWVASTYDIKFRRFLVEEMRFENFVITPKQTFRAANVETCIIILSNSTPKSSFIIERWDLPEMRTYLLSTSIIKPELKYAFPVYSDDSINIIVEKIRSLKAVLNDFAIVVWGVKIYENGKGKPAQKENQSLLRSFHSDKKIKKTHRPLLGGGEIVRYGLNWKGSYVDYGEWLAAPRQPHWFEGERILVREVTSKGVIQATIVNGDYVFSNSVDGIKMKTNDLEIKMILAILNSKLISFYHSNTSANAFKGTFPKVLLQDLRELPIPSVNQKIQSTVIKLVDQLLTLNEEKQQQTLQSKIDQIQNRIDYCEQRINEMVYELYGLTQEETNLIENT